MNSVNELKLAIWRLVDLATGQNPPRMPAVQIEQVTQAGIDRDRMRADVNHFYEFVQLIDAGRNHVKLAATGFSGKRAPREEDEAPDDAWEKTRIDWIITLKNGAARNWLDHLWGKRAGFRHRG